MAHMMMSGSGAMWAGMAVYGLLIVALAALALAGAVRLLRGRDASSAQSALDLRYARGELGRDEYLRYRADLAGSR